MRSRVLILGFAVVLAGVAFAAIAQPPAPPTVPTVPPPAQTAQPTLPPALSVPPSTPGTLPINPGTTPINAVPLSRFVPLEAFSAHTQTSVRAVLLSATWMIRMNQSHGRFLYGFNPSLRQPLLRDHDLHQARAALAMAQLARFTGEEKQAAIASQSILALLAATKVDPADPNCRKPTQNPAVCSRVGFAATLALAIYALPDADARLIQSAEQLCDFLHKQCRADGSVLETDGADTEADPAGVNEYPPLALQAIATGNLVRPAAWKLETANRGLVFYRNLFKTKPHPLLAAALTPACAELYQQAKSTEAAACLFELNDYICRQQIASNDSRIPQWYGGVRVFQNGQPTDIPSGPESGLYVQSLSIACQAARLAPDVDRHARYKAATQDAIQYLTELQYVETNTRHFESSFRANMLMGSFHLSPTEGNIRIDATATAVTGLLRYLSFAAQTE